MKYKIFELNGLSVNGVRHTTLEEVDFGFDETTFDTLESAVKYLKDNFDKYEYCKFVILPYIYLS